jgi:hypothetical protein
LLKNLLNSEVKSQNRNAYALKEKILFGTDFFMLQKDYRERRFGIDIRGYLSDEEYWLIAEENPKRFLKNVLNSNQQGIGTSVQQTSISGFPPHV